MRDFQPGWGMLWCTIKPHACPANSLSFNVADNQAMPQWWLPPPLSQYILFPARDGWEGTAGIQAKGHWQGPNARSYHVYPDPETGIPTLCAAKHVCLPAQVIISVRGLQSQNNLWHIIMNITTNVWLNNVLWTPADKLFFLWLGRNFRMKNVCTWTVAMIRLYYDFL